MNKFLSPVAVKQQYSQVNSKLEVAKKALGRKHLTLAEKILFSHFAPGFMPSSIIRGQSMLKLSPDRTIMQDATAQMAILQFMQAGRDTVAVPSSVHCDHLIRGKSGAKEDLEKAIEENKEVYEFLNSAAAKYGMGFWGPGSGIIHQVVLEKYAYPNALIIGTDSHTPNGGGLGLLAIGVGGADVADTMAGLAWEVRAPKLIGVKLTGKLSGWTSPKDVILYLCGKLTTKGGTNKIVEYFGEGTESISATGKATITNMGAELGATTSVFPIDQKGIEYLQATDRSDIAELINEYKSDLVADPEVHANPSEYYDEIVEINLSELEPYVVGPHSPDKARSISEFAAEIKAEGYPETLSAGLIGSCTNSSYEDIERAASIARQALDKGLSSKTPLFISPGSDQVYQTIKRDGQADIFDKLGAVLLTNACGPCIGNWDRSDMPKGITNSIITSFNRNFPKRNDGNPDTLAFIGSPDIVMAMALAGKISFNPITDTLENGMKLAEPVSPELPAQGFVESALGYEGPLDNRAGLEVKVSPTSKRLELLSPFAKWDGQDITDAQVLVKTKGQTTTDHISPAGRDWLPLRGHLSGISHNMLLGAVDASTGAVAESVPMEVNGVLRNASPWALKAMEIQKAGQGSIIVGDENYGEGSSREHAAMSPRCLGVKAVIVKSFARIHETNLKKQGVLPLTFSNAADYDKINKDDKVSIVDLASLERSKPVKAIINNSVEIELNHSLTEEQIEWFKAGSAMNAVQS